MLSSCCLLNYAELTKIMGVQNVFVWHVNESLYCLSIKIVTTLAGRTALIVGTDSNDAFCLVDMLEMVVRK